MKQRQSMVGSGMYARGRSSLTHPVEHDFDSSDDDDDPKSAASSSASLSSSARSLEVVEHQNAPCNKPEAEIAPDTLQKPSRRFWKSNSLLPTTGASPKSASTQGAPILRSAVRANWGAAATAALTHESELLNNNADCTRARAGSSFAMANPLRTATGSQSPRKAARTRGSVRRDSHVRQSDLTRKSGLAPLGTGAHRNPLAVFSGEPPAAVAVSRTRVRRSSARQSHCQPLPQSNRDFATTSVLRRRVPEPSVSESTAHIPHLVAADNFQGGSLQAGLAHELQANAMSNLLHVVEEGNRHDVRDNDDSERVLASFFASVPEDGDSANDSSSSDGAGGFTSHSNATPMSQERLFGGLTLDEFVSASDGRSRKPPQAARPTRHSTQSRQSRLARMGASQLPGAQQQLMPGTRERRTTSSLARRSQFHLGELQTANMRAGLRLSKYKSQTRGSLLGDETGDEGGDRAQIHDISSTNMVSNPLKLATADLNSHPSKRRSVFRASRKSQAPCGDTLPTCSELKPFKTSDMRDTLVVRSQNGDEKQMVQPTACTPTAKQSVVDHTLGHAESDSSDSEAAPKPKHVSQKARKEARKHLLLGWMKYLFRYNDLDSIFSWALLIVVGTGLASFVLLEASSATAGDTATVEAAALTGRDSALAQAYAGLVVCVVVGLLGLVIAAAELCMALLFFVWRHHAVRRLGMTAGWLGARERNDLSRMAQLARELDSARQRAVGQSVSTHSARSKA